MEVPSGRPASSTRAILPPLISRMVPELRQFVYRPGGAGFEVQAGDRGNRGQSLAAKLAGELRGHLHLDGTAVLHRSVGEAGDYKPGADRSKIVNTQEVDNLTWEFAEMVNHNQWIFEQVGEPAYILFRRTRGEPCGCVRPEAGIGTPRHGCPSCYETGVVGGYYGPYDLLYIPPGLRASAPRPR